jgi:DHA1 family multidrug resistance protein-like MFS transporter
MKRDLRTLTISLLFWGFGESLFLFFQPIYLQQLGADPLEIGTILAIMGFTMGLAQISTGYLSDRIGVKFILRTSWVMGTVATAMMAFAPNLSFYILGMLIYAITGAVTAPMNSYISSIRGNLSIGQAISIPVSGFNLGAIFGPLLGGFISQLVGLRAIYWLSFGFFVISSILAFYLKEKEVFPHDEKEIVQKPWQNKSFNIFLGLIFLLIFSSYLPIPLTPNFLFNIHNVPLSNLGILGALSSLGYILLVFFAAKVKPENNIIFSILLMLIFCSLIFFGKSTLVFSIAYLFASGYRFLRSMVMAYAHQLVHRNHLGIAYGLIESVAGIAITLAPLLAGFIFSKDVRFLYIAGAFCLIISLVSAFYFKKNIGVRKIG